MQNNCTLIWDEVLKHLKSQLNAIQYGTWIQQLEPLSMDESKFIIKAPNAFVKKVIENNFREAYFQSLICKLLSKEYTVIITDPDDDKFEEYKNLTPPKSYDKYGQQTLIPEGNKNDTPPKKKTTQSHSMLNPKYTFESFVKGSANQLALAAAEAVANNPAQAYNPFFIYGGAGLGKTHLMQACAAKILKDNPNARVQYLSSEKFTNDLIQSIADKSTKKSEAFRNKYRNIDVLLIDDIQFIAKKEATQEEFFHTFNDLYAANKQIILSSDRPPKDIQHLEDRLTSRFQWGLTADIQPPDFETRVAILQKKSKIENVKKIDIPMEVLEFIAMNIKSNIRELEGALTKVIAYATLTKEKKVTVEFAANYLSETFKKEKKQPITLDLIKEFVAKKYGISVEDLNSKNRSKQIAYPRQISMFIARKMTDLSLLKIADSFNRDHSTIMHGIDKITKDMKKDVNLKLEIETIIQEISNQ